ncbi:hypothetical protein BD410DRAFT_435697 [Rickenella mellea]|uniref:Uncharacterized protein n=1 Tax=Rickenella mellea TaxID=50990 RepID=A0A4Y7PGP5_9AGAM|nr:hypothetical protein BD410DRAFT_435697 [Rickenella mellea]
MQINIFVTWTSGTMLQTYSMVRDRISSGSTSARDPRTNTKYPGKRLMTITVIVATVSIRPLPLNILPNLIRYFREFQAQTTHFISGYRLSSHSETGICKHFPFRDIIIAIDDNFFDVSQLKVVESFDYCLANSGEFPHSGNLQSVESILLRRMGSVWISGIREICTEGLEVALLYTIEANGILLPPSSPSSRGGGGRRNMSETARLMLE